MNSIVETFKNIPTLLSVLSERPNSSFMENSCGSSSQENDFSGTSSFKEAVQLLQFGYSEIIPKIKKGMIHNQISSDKINYRKFQNMPVGFIPIVPNFLQNNPNSMVNIIIKPQKKKTLTIVYAITGNASKSQDFFINSGIALINAINMIELSGIQTRLYVDFMPTISGGLLRKSEIVNPLLKIKDFGERFNLTKVSFPLAHPSMLRRIGFKYLETCPFLTTSGFAIGYGRDPSLEDIAQNISKTLTNEKIDCVLDANLINSMNCDVKKVLNQIIGKKEI